MATRQMGIYNHQVFDHVALETPVTKLAAHLNPQRAAQQTARALAVATAYPAGPVLLNCPADYSRADLAQEAVYAPLQTLATCLAADEAETVRTMLKNAKRPLALLGRGALQARKSAVSGKSVKVRVDLGGDRFMKKKKKNQ